uniref:Uncharacterized protein n=1 Tax=viral metagenome TaxID=1070528 RepID=A0A6C0HLN9_9ZZZZ
MIKTKNIVKGTVKRSARTKKANGHKTKYTKKCTNMHGGGLLNKLRWWKTKTATPNTATPSTATPSTPKVGKNMFSISLFDLRIDISNLNRAQSNVYLDILMNIYIINNYAIKNIPWETLQNDLKFTFKYKHAYEAGKSILSITLDNASCILYEKILTKTKNVILKAIPNDYDYNSYGDRYIKLLNAVNSYMLNNTMHNPSINSKVKIPINQTFIKYFKKNLNLVQKYNSIFKIYPCSNVRQIMDAEATKYETEDAKETANAKKKESEYDKYISFQDLYIEKEQKLLYKLYNNEHFFLRLTVLNDVLVLIKYKIVNNAHNAHNANNANNANNSNNANNANKTVTQEATLGATLGATEANLNGLDNYLDFEAEENKESNENKPSKSNYLVISPHQKLKRIPTEIIIRENIEIEPKSLKDTKLRVAALLLTYNNSKENYEKALKYLDDMENIIKDSIINMESFVSVITEKNRQKYNSILAKIYADEIDYSHISAYLIYPCKYSIGNYRARINLANILDNVYNKIDVFCKKTKSFGRLDSIINLFCKCRVDNYKEINKLIPKLPAVEVQNNSYVNNNLEQECKSFINNRRKEEYEANEKNKALQRQYKNN